MSIHWSITRALALGDISKEEVQCLFTEWIDESKKNKSKDETLSHEEKITEDKRDTLTSITVESP